MYGEGEYDIAGFSVGAVEKTKYIDGSNAKPGDQIIGLPSSGIHSNGYSLVRKAMSHITGGGFISELILKLQDAGEAVLHAIDYEIYSTGRHAEGD